MSYQQTIRPPDQRDPVSEALAVQDLMLLVLAEAGSRADGGSWCRSSELRRRLDCRRPVGPFTRLAMRRALHGLVSRGWVRHVPGTRDGKPGLWRLSWQGQAQVALLLMGNGSASGEQPGAQDGVEVATIAGGGDVGGHARVRSRR